MASKGRSKTAENNSAQYKSSKRWETNRKRKLERVLKEQPNNEQIKSAMKSMVYRRKTPKTNEWSHTWIHTAKLFKLFCGKFDRQIMSSNDKTAQEVMHTSRKENTFVMPVGRDKSMFSILNRANINSFHS
jgi:hypothetical protein